MDAQIGKDNFLLIKKDTFIQICSSIKKNHHETGGIVGTDSNGMITAFQFDKINNPELFEYYPNTSFLNNVINNIWSNVNVSFIGFVHSHLHNDCISQQDIDYGREILKENKFLSNILIGIIDLSKKTHCIKWYKIDENSIFEVNVIPL